MLNLLRTNSENPEFQGLVHLLDKELLIRDGEDAAFYAQYNKIDMIRNVVIALSEDEAQACGAFKAYDAESVEIKRMYTAEAARRKGIAAVVLAELEAWAKELGYKYIVLETGIMQPEAIALYLKCGYELIPNYGQYIGMPTSKCYKKCIA